MLKINENAEKRIIRISGARLVAQADPCVYSCAASCLPGWTLPAAELVARAELPGALARGVANCQMCLTTFSGFSRVSSEIC